MSQGQICTYRVVRSIDGGGFGGLLQMPPTSDGNDRMLNYDPMTRVTYVLSIKVK